MVLIRLCHVADLPTPGELVRRFGNAPQPVAVPGGPSPGGGGVRALAGAAPAVAVKAAPAAPRLASLRDVATLVAERREAMLHAHLVHSVHLVRFAPPVIELRAQPDAPRDLAAKLAALLTDATGVRWTIALSAAQGEPTLAEQGSAADAARRTQAAEHPLVRAIMEAFPGARINQVHDTTVDTYGLPGQPAAANEADVEMEFADEMEQEE
jgi:DNA polymerase III subunit gamma/tau